MQKKYNRSNFHTHTFCVFKEVTAEKVALLDVGYSSKSGSVYYFTVDGVFRKSNHWGRAANCKWRLQALPEPDSRRTRIGFAHWTDFHPDNETEKLYFITVDINNGVATYDHKQRLPTGVSAVFRTAAETEKLLKQIRQLLQTTKWADHFDEDITTLRKTIIHELITTAKTLSQIRQELANN